jgi:hypothetical protein
MSRKTGAHFQTARTTRSLLKTLGGHDRKVVRQSARSSSKPSDRPPGSFIATPTRAKLFHEEPDAGNLHIRH